MTEIVTKAQAYAHLRIDNDSNGSVDDDWLDIFIPAISESIANWLKDDWRLYDWYLDSYGDPVKDSNGEPIPSSPLTFRWAVIAACLIELSSHYRFRDGEGDNVVPSDAGYGYVLSKAATALLTPLRKTTVA